MSPWKWDKYVETNNIYRVRVTFYYLHDQQLSGNTSHYLGFYLTILYIFQNVNMFLNTEGQCRVHELWE